MLRSPPDAHDEHVRMLLDQRANRADLQPSLSDYEDTPSVYSRAFFSPHPYDISKDHDSAIIASPPPLTSRSSSLPRRMERNRINELAVSMLDLEDEERPRASFESSSTYDEDMADQYIGSDDDDNDAPMPRMSLLGPKMRFHSKAPWELEDSPLMEDAEGEDVDNDIASMRNNFAVSSSSQAESRQASFESATVFAKHSFETSSSYSRGPPSHASANASNYTLPCTPFSQNSHVRSQSPASGQDPLLLPPASRSSPESYISSLHEDDNTLSRIRSNSSRLSPSSSEEDNVHPYANPSHARISPSNCRRPSDASNTLSFPFVSRSDSTATCTAAEPPFRAGSSSITQSEFPPVPRSPCSIFQGKEISSPVPLYQTTSNQSTSYDAESIRPNQLPGWMDKVMSSPNFNLISLEEARAQRSRSSTTQTPPPSGSVTDREFGHSPSNSVASRARARSISAGARAKQAISSIVSGPPAKTERRDSEPTVPQHQPTAGTSPGKNLKHKKSGFMRLFNGRDDKSPPPPVPPLSDGVAAYHAQQSKPSLKLPHRIPVPKLSPFPPHMDEQSSQFTSPKRTPPPLSINTVSPVPRAPSTGPSTGLGTHFSNRSGESGVAQSAPPNVTEFPALQLRPVSTMFSSQFGDILTQGAVASPTDLETPSSVSTSTVVSPTSVTFGRFGEVPSIMTSSDDPSSVIQVLQAQIDSSKKTWQRHIWELEGQIRDLKAEVEALRHSDGEYCSACGRGEKADTVEAGNRAPSVMQRPRARTGTGSSRFGCST